MPKKGFIPQKYKIWIEKRKKYHLSHAQVQMARELDLNPDKLGKIANNNQEPWKLPLPAFIEKIYYKRFKRALPLDCRSLEQRAKDERKKKEEQKIRKKEGAASAIENKTFEQKTVSQEEDEIPI